MKSTQLEKLKKRLLREERKRRRRSSSRRNIAVTILLLCLFLASAAWLGHEPLAAWLYGQGQRLFRQQEYASAIRALSWAERLSMGELAPKARLLVGDIQNLEQENPQQAILTYLTLVRDFSRTPQAEMALRRAADIYLDRLDDPSEALPLLQRLADAGVADADAIRYRIADSYFKLHNYEQARIEFETLLRLFPDTRYAAETSYRIGVCLVLENRLDQAERQFRATAQRWSNDAFGLEAQFALAGLFERRDELVRARELLVKLRTHYPKKDLLEHRLKKIEDRIRRKKKAI